MAEELYRVVLDGPAGSTASLPHPRGEALRAFDAAVEDFGPEIAAGMRVSVLADVEYARRAEL